MAAAWMWARSELRRGRRSALLLALLVGLGGGVVLTTLAGARRTETAFDRLLESSAAADVRVQYTPEEDVDELVLERLRAHPDVERAASMYIAVAFTEATEYDIGVFSSADPALFREIDRPRVLAGRVPAVDAPDEVLVTEFLADELGVGVGDRVPLETFTVDQLETFAFDEPPGGPVLDLHVVGIGRLPDDLIDAEASTLLAGPAFRAAYQDRVGAFGPNVELLVRPGADADAIVAGALDGVDLVEPAQIETTDARSARVRDATGVLSAGLWLFAGCAALAMLVAGGQAITRRMGALAADQEALQSLGLSRTQRTLGAVLTAVPVAVAAGAFAVLTAVAASPLMPVGLARRAEPDRGVDLDALVLVVGAAGIVLTLVTIAAASAWRLARLGPSAAPVGRLRRSAGAAAAARAGWSPASVLGITMALEPGRGRTAVPVRPAVVGAVVGIAGVVAVATFGASLDHLVTTPPDYGWNWAISPDLFEGDAEALAALPEVSDVGHLLFTEAELEGEPVQGMAVQAVEGTPSLTVLDGRMPGSAGEVALGPATVDDLGVRLGDQVELAAADGGSVDVVVVGEVLFPVFDDNAFNDGVAVHAELLGDIAQSDGFGQAIIDFAPGVSDDEGIAAVREARPDSLSVYAFPSAPGDVENLAQVRSVPSALAVFLVLVALAAVGHALVTAVRRRRRDIGVVRSLGFLRRDVLSGVAVQSSTLVLIGVLIGFPLGIAAGRLAWTLVASGLGVRATTALPTLPLALLVPGALIAAAAIAAFPARVAARISPAVALRAE